MHLFWVRFCAVFLVNFHLYRSFGQSGINNSLHVFAAKFLNNDDLTRQIAEYMFKHGGYVPRHPLTRNW